VQDVNIFDESVGADSISARIELNHAGQMIKNIFDETINSYEYITADIYVIMPNHFHCILSISRADMESAPTIGDVIQSFKRNTTIKYIQGVKDGIYPPFRKRIWQRDYYEHIIRNNEEYQQKWRYIDENPARWEEDEHYN
jgi:REP element-mobilizing transposase RayT